MTHLLPAIASNDPARITTLLLAGVDPNQLLEGRHALIWALDEIEEGANIALLDVLLDGGAHIEGDPNEPATPLLVAVSRQLTSAAHRLLAAGANPCVRDEEGYTPLGLAAQRADVALVQHLLASGAAPCVDVPSGPVSFTPLQHAAFRRDVALMKVLIEAGANPGLRPSRGASAIDILRQRGDEGGVLTGVLEDGSTVHKEVSMPDETSARLFDAITSFFTTDNWCFDKVKGRPVLSMSFAGQHGHWMCFAQVREEHEQFLYYSVAPVKVPEAHLQKVAEFITRVNYGMIMGNFEMDFSDGEVRYKTSIDVENTELTYALIKQVVYANVLTMDRYFNSLLNVALGSVDVVDAVDAVKG